MAGEKSNVPALLDHRGKPISVTPNRRARASLSGESPMAFAYDASDWTQRETGGWLPWIYSPDHEINVFRDRMVGRSRDLRRNDGWASGGINTILDATIGHHYKLMSKPDYRALSFFAKGFDFDWANEFRHAVEAKFRSWANDPNRYSDAQRQLGFTQQMRLALAHKLVDGEDLIVLDWLPDRVGYGAASYATAVRLVDPDRLSNPMETVDTLTMRGGVEIDEDGVAIAYHIRRAHQNDWYGAVESMIWDRVDRETDWGRPIIIHDFDSDRTDTHRGVPIFAPIMNRMKMLTTFDRATMQTAVINAIFALAVKSPYDPEGVRDALEIGDDNPHRWYWQQRKLYRDERPIGVQDARILNLFPGEEADAIKNERPGAAHDPYTHYVLRHIAAATGASAAQISKDWSKVNYSSARAEILDAIKTIHRRSGDFAAGTASPIYAAWLEEAMDKGEFDLPKGAPDFLEARAAYSACAWVGPGRGWIDPVKEAQAAVLRMDAGISTLQQECADQGADYESNIDQRAHEVKLFKERGLKLPEWAGVDAEVAAEKPTRPEPV